MTDSGYLIKSVVKAFNILEVFKNKKSVSVTELSKNLNIPKSTVFNLLHTLEYLDYIKQNKVNKKYKLGFNILKLSQAIEYDLRNEAKPYLLRLSEKTNETINLVIRIDEKVLYIEKVESTEPININTRIGKKEDLYCTAAGKSILAYLEEKELNNIFKKIDFFARTPNTITNLKKLKEELIKIKKQGYAIDNEEFSKGVKCIAAPILNYKEKPISAISITGPADRIIAKGENKLASLVIENTRKVSKKLGYSN